MAAAVLRAAAPDAGVQAGSEVVCMRAGNRRRLRRWLAATQRRVTTNLLALDVGVQQASRLSS